MAIKVFEPEDDSGEEPDRDEVAVIFKRDTDGGSVRERHEFTVEPRWDWQNLRGLLHLLDSRDSGGISPQMLMRLDRLIRRSLVNDDGTPEKWQAQVVNDGADEPWFTDPNGDHCPADMLPAYEAFEAGSSRRRWMHLIDGDEEVTIEAAQILALANYLMELAGKDRTKKSAASTG